MATTHPLNATKRLRTGSGKLNELRREGLVPAVVYGKGFENVNIKVDAKEFSTLLASSASEHILVDLDVEGQKLLALIQDVQHNPLTGAVLHVDFLAVDENKIIHAQVPVVLTGEAAGIKQGGLLDQSIYSIVVLCAAKDLPETIEVDVTNLEVGAILHVADVKFPSNVKPALGADVVVATILETASAISEQAGA